MEVEQLFVCGVCERVCGCVLTCFSVVQKAGGEEAMEVEQLAVEEMVLYQCPVERCEMLFQSQDVSTV